VVKSAHDCSEGGLAVALAESCISQQIARDTPRLIEAEIDLTYLLAPGETSAEQPGTPESAAPSAADTAPAKLRLDALIFGETQGRIVISVAAINAVKVLAQTKILGVSAARIGTVGGSALQIKAGARALACDLRELHELWWNSIARAMQ